MQNFVNFCSLKNLIIVSFLDERKITSMEEIARLDEDYSLTHYVSFVHNGILMRRLPDVSADDEWTVNYQIVVPLKYLIWHTNICTWSFTGKLDLSKDS